jgi:hypothetical protein
MQGHMKSMNPSERRPVEDTIAVRQARVRAVPERSTAAAWGGYLSYWHQGTRSRCIHRPA